MRKQIFTVRTLSGITFHLEAQNYAEARARAESPEIGIYLARLMQQAVSNIRSIEPHHGPTRMLKYPLFEDEIFKH